MNVRVLESHSFISSEEGSGEATKNDTVISSIKKNISPMKVPRDFKQLSTIVTSEQVLNSR